METHIYITHSQSYVENVLSKKYYIYIFIYDALANALALLEVDSKVSEVKRRTDVAVLWGNFVAVKSGVKYECLWCSVREYTVQYEVKEESGRMLLIPLGCPSGDLDRGSWMAGPSAFSGGK